MQSTVAGYHSEFKSFKFFNQHFEFLQNICHSLQVADILFITMLRMLNLLRWVWWAERKHALSSPNRTLSMIRILSLGQGVGLDVNSYATLKLAITVFILVLSGASSRVPSHQHCVNLCKLISVKTRPIIGSPYKFAHK